MVFPNFDRMDWFVGGYDYDKIDNPRKFQNEFESFKSRVGKHTPWFDALSSKNQWDLLFLWKKKKYFAKENKNQVSLRKFLYEMRNKRKFFVSKQKLRESALNNLFN